MSWKPNTVKLDVEDGWTMEHCLNADRKSTMQECTGSSVKKGSLGVCTFLTAWLT